jgi:exosortase
MNASMMNSPATPAVAPAAWRQPLLLVNLGLLGAFTVALSVQLWPQWRGNPDLSHGFFMPVIFLLLLHESRTHGTRRYLPAGGLTLAGSAVLAALGLLAMIVGGTYAVGMGWSYTMVSLALTAAFVLFGLAALTSFASEKVRLIPCNWNSLSALGLWLLCAPLPPGSYLRLSLAMQFWVTKNVLHALHFLGIAAHRQGNIIELANTSVGIEDACSGVRSLVSCVFAGLFFAAGLVQRPWKRVLLVALAVPLAVGMNLLRSLLLTLLAYRGVNIAGTWHDATGFAVLGVTAAALGGLALLLARDERSRAPAAEPADAPDLAAAPAARRSLRVLAGGLTLGAGLAVFFASHTQFSAPPGKPAPDLLALLPTQAAGWRVASTEDLYRFREQLKTDNLIQRSYVRLDPAGPTQLTVYFAYWAPGQSNPGIVATHTPDGCWPGAGWVQQPTGRTNERITTLDRPLAEAEYRLFTSNGFPQYVWYWHLYDGRPLVQRNVFSPVGLLRMVFSYGFKPPSDQLFVRLSCNRPWSTIARDPLIAEIFRRLQPLGL